MSQLSELHNRASAAVQPHYQKVQPYLAKAHQQAQAHLAPIDKELSRFPALNRFEQQTGVPKAYLGVGTFVLFVSFIFFNVFASLLTNALGFFIPAYYSLQALQSPSPNDDTQWLTYWTVFGFFSVLEGVADTLVYWFPFYYTGKALFLVWLMLPQTQGAKIIYANLLRPAFFQTPKGALPAGYYANAPSSLAAAPTSTTTSTSGQKSTPSVPPRSSATSSAVPSSNPLSSYATAPSSASPSAPSVPPTSSIPSGTAFPASATGTSGTSSALGASGLHTQAAQAVHAAQHAQALDGVKGHIPPDLSDTVDALAHGDFAKAEASNPFR